MDITRTMILKKNINNDLLPKIVFAITYIKNSQQTRALQNISPYKVYFHEQPNLTHLQILGSTAYILLYKEKSSIKSEKWALRALKKTLIGYDRYTIYRV